MDLRMGLPVCNIVLARFPRQSPLSVMMSGEIDISICCISISASEMTAPRAILAFASGTSAMTWIFPLTRMTVGVVSKPKVILAVVRPKKSSRGENFAWMRSLSFSGTETYGGAFTSLNYKASLFFPGAVLHDCILIDGLQLFSWYFRQFLRHIYIRRAFHGCLPSRMIFPDLLSHKGRGKIDADLPPRRFHKRCQAEFQFIRPLECCNILKIYLLSGHKGLLTQCHHIGAFCRNGLKQRQEHEHGKT